MTNSVINKFNILKVYIEYIKIDIKNIFKFKNIIIHNNPFIRLFKN